MRETRESYMDVLMGVKWDFGVVLNQETAEPRHDDHHTCAVWVLQKLDDPDGDALFS